ncbi:phage tail-collar fiber domain-containing protein [Acinetobacter guillouiae]|uniref:phage tail-collar fiber domain-containing protein n=1 Tax=Acinetobacter guillouiae TaxID=106649 RepID=UPI001250218B|nr:phage tail protein [Acinetobacter guillouiae]
MAAKYYVALTEYGSSLIAQAHNVVSIQLTAMVIGDANNQPYDPIDQKGRTTLINERAKVPVQSVEIIGQIARVSATIEAQIGGFNIHEYGFIDATGKLVYIANFHGAYKPAIAEGAGGELEIVTDIKANSGAQILVQIDSNVVTANKQWVLNQLDKKYDKTGGRISGDTSIDGILKINSDSPNAEVTIRPNNLTHGEENQINFLSGDRIEYYYLDKPIRAPTEVGGNWVTLGGDRAFGTGQTWHDVTSNRISNTTYTNSKPYPIQICIYLEAGGNGAIVNVTVGGLFLFALTNTTAWGTSRGCAVIVPPNTTYKVDGQFTKWTELS